MSGAHSAHLTTPGRSCGDTESQPSIDYQDESRAAVQAIGEMGLTSLAPATFSIVGYAANNPRP